MTDMSVIDTKLLRQFLLLFIRTVPSAHPPYGNGISASRYRISTPIFGAVSRC